MRILSQEGLADFEADVPYEQCGLYLCFNKAATEKHIINARMSTGEVYKMAEYSAKQKAQKAMEMLRNEYLQTVAGRSEYVYTLFDYPKIFRFPTDDEIEVQQ